MNCDTIKIIPLQQEKDIWVPPIPSPGTCLLKSTKNKIWKVVTWNDKILTSLCKEHWYSKIQPYPYAAEYNNFTAIYPKQSRLVTLLQYPERNYKLSTGEGKRVFENELHRGYNEDGDYIPKLYTPKHDDIITPHTAHKRIITSSSIHEALSRWQKIKNPINPSIVEKEFLEHYLPSLKKVTTQTIDQLLYLVQWGRDIDIHYQKEWVDLFYWYKDISNIPNWENIRYWWSTPWFISHIQKIINSKKKYGDHMITPPVLWRFNNILDDKQDSYCVLDGNNRLMALFLIQILSQKHDSQIDIGEKRTKVLLENTCHHTRHRQVNDALNRIHSSKDAPLIRQLLDQIWSMDKLSRISVPFLLACEEDFLNVNVSKTIDKKSLQLNQPFHQAIANILEHKNIWSKQQSHWRCPQNAVLLPLSLS